MRWDASDSNGSADLGSSPRSLSPEDMDALWECLCDDYLRGRLDLKESLCRLEKYLLIKTLGEFGGNQKKSSEFLCLKPTTLNAKCKKYNIRFATHVR